MKSLCLEAYKDGSVINMQGNQVTDKTIHRSDSYKLLSLLFIVWWDV